jgi:MFS family permease
LRIVSERYICVVVERLDSGRPSVPVRRRVATAAVLLGLVVAAFEGTVVASAMPTIVRELGGMTDYAWVFSSFLIASTLAVLVCGKLADAFGRMPVFVGGMGLFLVGSALCGASTSFGELIGFRVLQGLGAGALQPIAMVISADMYTLEERARVQALFTSAWGVSNVVGPVIGGWIVMHASWRWVFLVNVPVGALAVALLVASYRDPADARRGTASTTSTILRDPVVRSGLVGGAFVGSILYTCAAYVPLWMSARSGADALAAGVALVPLLVGWAFGSSFGVRVLVRHGMRASVGGGFAIALAGAAALAFVVAFRLPAAWALAAMGLLGLGVGPAASTSLVASQSSVPWRHRGAVTSAVYAARMLGGSLAVTAIGAAGAWTRDAAVARFAGVAILALGATLSSLELAPRGRGAVVSEALCTPAE